MRCVRGRVEGDGRRVRWILFYSRPGRVVCVRARVCVCVCVCVELVFYGGLCSEQVTDDMGRGTEEVG